MNNTPVHNKQGMLCFTPEKPQSEMKYELIQKLVNAIEITPESPDHKLSNPQNYLHHNHRGGVLRGGQGGGNTPVASITAALSNTPTNRVQESTYSIHHQHSSSGGLFFHRAHTGIKVPKHFPVNKRNTKRPPLMQHSGGVTTFSSSVVGGMLSKTIEPGVSYFKDSGGSNQQLKDLVEGLKASAGQIIGKRQ